MMKCKLNWNLVWKQRRGRPAESVGCLVLLLAAGWMSSCGGQMASAPLRLGTSLPPFELVDLDGRVVSSSGWKGMPTVINFWATWCIPCRKEIPVLQELADEGKVRIVGIALDEGREELVREYVRDAGLTYRILLGDQKLFELLDGLTIPYTLVLDEDGLLHRLYRGPVTREDLMRDLEELSAKGRGPGSVQPRMPSDQRLRDAEDGSGDT